MENLTIRDLREDELGEADRIFRLAFGTFLGLPDPLAFAGDASWVATRWRAAPDGALAAELDGVLVGSNLLTRWGSVGCFGPLSVRPDLWDRGIARHLLEATIARFEAWGTRNLGLFTFAQSAKHVGLYQRFGFWPRFLTAVMEATAGAGERGLRWSELGAVERGRMLERCRSLTDAVHPGLDLTREITAVETQSLGDVVLVLEGDAPAGIAICHCGAGSEAGSNACYVKIAAVRPGPRASAQFEVLLDACAALAFDRGMSKVVAGVNTARRNAYRRLVERGFRTTIQGVAMHRPDDPIYNRPEVLLLDDWR